MPGSWLVDTVFAAASHSSNTQHSTASLTMPEFSASLFKLLSHIPTRQWLIYIAVALVLALSEGLGFLILIPLLTSGTEYSNKLFSDIVVNTNDRIAMALFVFFALFSLRSVLTRIQRKMSFDLEVNIVDPFRLKLLSAIQNTEWEQLSGRKQGDFHDLFNTTLIRFAGAVQLLLSLCVAGLTFTVYIGLLVWTSPSMSLSALALLSPLFLLAVWKNRKIVALGHDITTHSKVLHHRLQESLGTLRVSRRQTLKDWHWVLMDKAQINMRNSQYGFVRLQNNLQMAFQMLGAALLCGYLYTALVIIKTPLAELGLLILGFARLYPLLTRIQQMIQSLKFAGPSVKALRDELDWLSSNQEPQSSHGAHNNQQSAFPDIELDNIELSYQKDGNHYCLTANSITIPSGSLCCIVGPSGQGKSTLLDLIAGVHQARKGKLTLKGLEHKPADDVRMILRESNRYVTQDNPLIHGTIRENLLMGNPILGDEELKSCLELVNGSFVFELAQQLDTAVGDRGQQLSGGQKQRILLANALLAKPALLILDEATSALDRQSEETVLQTLLEMKRHCTIVMVSHRTSALELADVLIAVDGGLARQCTLEEARRFCV